MRAMVWKRSTIAVMCSAWFAIAACGQDAPELTLKDREVTVACGRCVFAMPEATVGCPWAVELDGKHYIIQGQVPQDHMNHAPDGICNMPRRAVVSGHLRGDRFITTKLELKPAADVPAQPRFTPEDAH